MFQKPVRITPLCAALLAALTVAATPAAALSTPPLIWQDVSKISVQCLVQPRTGDAPAIEAALCDRVSRIASDGAPAAVAVVPVGDPSVLAPGVLTLLVHASVEPAAGGRQLAFAIRPVRVANAPFLFGAAPRAATIPPSAAGSSALNAALGAALAETLPWLAKPQGPRPITDRN